MEHKRVWRKHSKTDAWNHACCFKLQCFWRKNALKNECVRVRVKIFVVKREPTSACAPTCSICTSAPRDAATLQRQKNSQLRRPPVGRSVALIYMLTAYIRTCIQTQCALIHTYSQIFEGERRLNCCLLARKSATLTRQPLDARGQRIHNAPNYNNINALHKCAHNKHFIWIYTCTRTYKA